MPLSVLELYEVDDKMILMNAAVVGELAKEAEVLRQNLLQCHFFHYKDHMT
jgi:hypothetical protein